MEIFDADPVVVEACRAAQQAFTTWSSTPPQERAEALTEAANILEASAEELAELNVWQTGKLLTDSRAGVTAGIATLRQYAQLGPLHQGQRLRGEGKAIDYSIPEPRGVVAVITPWNDPVAIACGLIGAALVTGNVVVHKPSERCPELGERLGDLLAGAFPPGVLTTVSGPGRTGAEIIAQPEVAMVAHVGSTTTGAEIARAAALTGAHVILENGGNDPLIVDDGVDVQWAAQQAALGCFTNAGQICTAVERIYVHQNVAEEFTHVLCEQARRWEEDGRLGPLVDEELRTEVHSQVAESIEQGARLARGGKIPPGTGRPDAPNGSSTGAFYPATVLTECTPQMPVFEMETFGPVAAIAQVPSFADALNQAACDPHGLAATVLTTSMDHAHRAATHLPVGTVKINNVFGGAPGGSAQPRGWSGQGFGYGPRLLDEMTRLKVVHYATGRARQEER